ncbi:hypothetical protein ACLOJK_005201 [Asimina triloba]
MQVQAEKNAEQVGRTGEEGRGSTKAMAGLGGDGRMRGLGRRTGEEKRRGLEGGERLVAGGGGRAGKTHGRGEEKGTRGRRETGRWKGREGWEDARERRREGDLGAAGGWSLEGAGGLGRRTREENRWGLGGGRRLVAGGGGRAGKTAEEKRRGRWLQDA